MKKTLVALLLFTCYTSFAQTLLATHPLEMKGSSNHEIFTVTDTAYSQLAVFAADKESMTATRFNGAVFFTDSLSTPRPDKEYTYMAGYSFDGNRPGVYWADGNLKKIQGVYFDFENKIVARMLFDMPYEKDEEILSSFSENNSFYIITLHPSKDELKFYIFNKGTYEVKTADFSAYSFVTSSNKKATINQLLSASPLQKIETKTFNDLLTCSSKMKFYMLPDKMLITLDHNPAFTQLFTIDTKTFTVAGRIIPQATFTEEADANSYYLEGVLYRIKLNSDEIGLSALKLDPDREIRSYHATREEAIDFKNSALISQSGNGRPDELRDTKKFLRKIGSDGAAISVYRTPDDILVTAGGVRTVIPAGYVVAGGVLLMAGGGGGMDMFDGGQQQTTYFESLFDDNFEHRTYRIERLALDNAGQFTAGNKRVSLQTVIPFKGYYLLGYYDAKAKLYVMRKFEDDMAY